MNFLNIKLSILILFVCMCLNKVNTMNITTTTTTTIKPTTIIINFKCISSEYCRRNDENGIISRGNYLNMEMEMEPEQDKDEDWSNWLKAQEENVKANKKKKKKKRKRKRRKQKGDKKKKRPKRKKIKKKGHHQTEHTTFGQPANVLLATLQSLPEPLVKPTNNNHHSHHHHHQQQQQQQLKPFKHKKRIKRPTTTTTPLPLKHIKLLFEKSQLLKKKKKQYLSHLGAVFYPLVKFIAFFTVLNPFTFAVFFFMLISPIVFGILGFTAISLVLKPVLNLLFAVKHNIVTKQRNRSRYNSYRKRQRQRQRQRPITIHKHYYQQPTIKQQHKYKPIKHILHARNDLINKPHLNLLPPITTTIIPFDPILPHIKHKIQQIPPQQQLFTNHYNIKKI